ncbi:MAG: hypothetical protein J6T32_03105, partial [Paludibacteraceae bacterium]|nr:hypothetical protein [Paludibacteraceae bacterium]
MLHRTRRILLLLALLIGSAGASYMQAAKAILAAKANNASYGRVRIGNGNWTTTQNASTSVTTATGQSHVLYASPFTGYHFVNWTNNINTTTSTSTNLTVRVTTTSALYTANFAINTYTITASPNNTNYGTVTGGGTYNYGASATLKATPKTGYHFVQWNDGVTTATRTISNITANATYTATFAINTYTITFKNEDGTTLKTQTVNHGVTPTAPSTPTQSATAQYTYTFKAWSPTIAAATKDQTYTATYTATVRSYTIRFMNGNTPLQTNTLKYGATPNYTGSTPTKASTAQYSYTFNGWSPAIYAVNKAQDYVAQFTSTTRSYKITGASANTTMGTVSGTATKQ